MELQKLMILGDLGDYNFYVMKSFLIDTNTLKYCQNSKFVKKFKRFLKSYIVVQTLYIELIVKSQNLNIRNIHFSRHLLH